MNRRELLKSSLLLAGSLSALNLGGCADKNAMDSSKTGDNTANDGKNIIANNEKNEIANSSIADKSNKKNNLNNKFKITSPLPFNKDLTDKLTELNSKYKKSKITSLYNSLPFPLALNLEGYHSRRGINKNIKTIDDFLYHVNYAQNKGFEFVYTLNSPRPILEGDFKKTSKELFVLLDELKNSKAINIKVANPQLLLLLSEKYPEFNFHASTSFEYHNLSQYANLMKNFPNIKLFDIAIDENRNFEFLKNLKKTFPNVELEIMVNEPCLRGCPARISHCATHFCEFDCMKIINKNWIEEFTKSGVIYPWNLDIYQNIGIDRFKFISVGSMRADIKDVDYLINYLDMLENPQETISKTKFSTFLAKIVNSWQSEEKIKDIALEKVIPYLPDINYFIKNGSKCASECGAECFYCMECAKKLRRFCLNWFD